MTQAEELLKEAAGIFEIPNRIRFLEKVIEWKNKYSAYLKSQESSVTVTEGAASWEQCLESAAWENGSMNWRDFVEKSQDVILKQAAHLFMEANRQQRWIQVEERLPDSEQLIICFVDGKVDLNMKYSQGCFMMYFGGDREREDVTKYVTHWQPLPEIPKESKG